MRPIKDYEIFLGLLSTFCIIGYVMYGYAIAGMFLYLSLLIGAPSLGIYRYIKGRKKNVKTQPI